MAGNVLPVQKRFLVKNGSQWFNFFNGCLIQKTYNISYLRLFPKRYLHALANLDRFSKAIWYIVGKWPIPLGINLVRSYVAGLGGEIEMEEVVGTRYVITFSEYEECRVEDL